MTGPGNADVYRGTDKHKRPWRVGVSGSQCGDADGAALFAGSVAHPTNESQRFATDGRRWFRALTGDHGEPGTVLWHGHPVEPADVPVVVQKVFVERGVLRRFHLSKVVAA